MLAGIVAGCLLVGAMSLYGVGTLSASVPRWLVIYAGAGLAIGWLCVSVVRRRLTWDRVDAAALALFAYMAASLLWSGDWRQGLYGLVNAGALLAIFLAVRRVEEAARFLRLAALVGVAAALLLQWLWPWDFGGHGNEGFQTELILAGLALGWEPARGVWWPPGIPREHQAELAEWPLSRWLWLPVALASLVYLVGFNDSRIEYWVAGCLLIGWLCRRWWRAANSGSTLSWRGWMRQSSATD